MTTTTRFAAATVTLALLAFFPAAGRAQDSGYVIERESAIAKKEPGPHKGRGMSTGHAFFENVRDFGISFRKRILHPGASIGYHQQKEDEVYYIAGGEGKMTINGKEFAARPGDCFLTRKGSSHGIEQAGSGDLTIIIAYGR